MRVTVRIARASAAILAVVLLTGTGAGVPAARAAAGAGPRGAVPAAPLSTPVPNPGPGAGLTAVTCISARSCWAVGSYSPVPGHSSNEALHWNGSTWSVVATPDGGTAATDHNGLYGVACAGPADCWAVGVSSPFPYQTSEGQILHWNGHTWSLVKLPDADSDASLFAVQCPARSECQAIGRLDGNGSGRAVILRWNGKLWSAVALPLSRASALAGLACVSPTDCRIVGNRDGKGEAFHWNGRRWSVAAAPRREFGSNGLACTSARNCWTAGKTAAQHWNGARWSVVATPRKPRVANTGGIACTWRKNCWAMEEYFGAGGTGLNLAIHWNGTSWSKVSMPQAGGTGPDVGTLLTGVTCTSSSNCLAVGRASVNSGEDLVNEAVHWNGTRWSAG